MYYPDKDMCSEYIGKYWEYSYQWEKVKEARINTRSSEYSYQGEKLKDVWKCVEYRQMKMYVCRGKNNPIVDGCTANTDRRCGNFQQEKRGFVNGMNCRVR